LSYSDASPNGLWPDSPHVGFPRKICAVKDRGRGASFSRRYLLRAVGIGVLVSVLTFLALIVFAVLPGHPPLDVAPYVGVIAAGVTGVILASGVPWSRVFRDGRGPLALLAWIAFDVALITAAVAFSGKGASDLWILYVLTVVFAAATCRVRAQAVMFGGTVAAYLLTIAALGLHATMAELFVRTTVLALVALLAGLLSRELVRETRIEAAATGESERARGLMGRLLGRVVKEQEEERIRVGLELRDELGQLLASILYFARRLEHDLTGSDAARATQIVETAERALAGTRRLVREVRPVELDHIGLVSAVRRLAYDTEDHTGLRISVHAEDMDRPLGPDLETAAFRVIEEALENIVAHAGATEVVIELARGDDELFAAVQDNGRGFDPAAVSRAAATGGVGLVGMLERARLVEGEVRIESAPGEGTLVRMRAPIPVAPGEERTGSSPEPEHGAEADPGDDFGTPLSG
jgi:signal transduction histidine kinase